MSPFRINCSVEHSVSHQVVNSLLRSFLVYAAPVFFYALPKYLQRELERVQKRVFVNHLPQSVLYDEALNEAGIPTIISYCEDICDKVFNTALDNKDNKPNI